MKRRRLSPEEERLWGVVVKGVDAYRTPRHHHHQADAQRSAHGSNAASRPSTVAPPPGHVEARRPAREGQPTAASRARVAAFNAGDPKLDRRVASRRMQIDRTLDLHGCRQDKARSRLTSFLQTAHADGCRCVLVITGKGGPASAAQMTRARSMRAAALSGEADPPHASSTPPASRDQRDDAAFMIRNEAGGVLRTRVREWVDAPPLRRLVARLARARPKDGGDGAYYVFLKARERRQPIIGP